MKFLIIIFALTVFGCDTTNKEYDYLGTVPAYAKKVKKSIDISPDTCQNGVLTIKKGEYIYVYRKKRSLLTDHKGCEQR